MKHKLIIPALLFICALFTLGSASAQQNEPPYSKHHQPTPTCCQFKPKDEPLATPIALAAMVATAMQAPRVTLIPLLPVDGADLTEQTDSFTYEVTNYGR